MDALELRDRVDRLELPMIRVAPLLGLSVSGLMKQLHGQREVTQQTALLLAYVEKDEALVQRERDRYYDERRERIFAQMLAGDGRRRLSSEASHE